MLILHTTINKQKGRLKGETVSGQVNSIGLQVTFSDEWAEYTRYAVFSNDVYSEKVLLDANDFCRFPNVFLADEGDVEIGFVGEKTDKSGAEIQYVSKPMLFRIRPGTITDAETVEETLIPDLISRTAEDVASETNAVADYAFYRYGGLKSVNLPKVKSVGAYAFSECADLGVVKLPEAASVESYAYVTMLNKLIFGHKLILRPYLKALQENSGDEDVQRIKRLEEMLSQNMEQRELLTRLMAQGYIDQILYTRENNALLEQADGFRREIDAINNSTAGDMNLVTETEQLLHFAERGSMIAEFNDLLFEKFVDCIRVDSRQQISFVLKCGLMLSERIGDYE